MNRSLLAVLLVASLVVLSVPAFADVRGEPDISLSAADNRVSPGQVTTFGVTVLNAGDVDEGSAQDPSAERRVTTARGLTLEMDSGDAPVEVQTGKVAVGSVPEGAVGPISFRIAVDEDAEPGTYEVPVTVRYVYTSSISQQNGNEIHEEESVRRTIDVDLTVEEGALFAVANATTDATAGGGGTLALEVENVGTGTARNASMQVQVPSGDLLFGNSPTTEAFAGTWEPGETRRFEFGATVPPGTARRPLSLRTTVSYEDDDGLPRQDSVTAGVTPAGEEQFAVESVTTTAAVGDRGTLRVALRNTGDRTVRDATVGFQSPNAALTFGGAPAARTFVGAWEPDETRTLAVEAGFAPTAENRSYAVDATVSYARANHTVQAKPLTFGVAPADEQAFDLGDVNATLRVGNEGQLTGTVVNEGPATAENAVLVLEPAGSVSTAETEFALGDLGANESAQFAYDLEVSSSAREGPRQFTLRVRYEDAKDDEGTTLSDPLFARATVGPRREAFAVEPVEAEVQAGKSARLVLEVTNTAGEPLEDVSAKLFADAPISANDDEAFVDSLAPGESTQLVFEVGAGGGAIPKAYPVSLDFQYTEPDGDTKLSDTYRVPVQVTESEGGLLPFAVGRPGFAVGALGALGWSSLALGTAAVGAMGFVLVRRLR